MKAGVETDLRLLIAGGGTGGHLFPGVAVAKEWHRRHPAAKILFVTGQKKIESEILSALGFEQVSIRIEGLKGRGWLKALKVLFFLPVSFWQSLAIIRRFNPQVVLGVGGYSSGPVCLAAWMVNVPSAVQEQNSYPGFTNRLLSRIVDKVFIAYQESNRHFKRQDLVLSGNPVREQILKALETGPNKESPVFTVLVVGGSQGAKAVNQAVIDALEILREAGSLPRILHQTGADDYERIKSLYEQKGLQGNVLPFIQDMAGAYGEADLVISRAGASTLAELAALGKPSILIPFPHAANNHQESNAALLVRTGGAEMILQKDLNGQALANAIGRYMRKPENLEQMAERARSIGRTDAAGMIVDHLSELISRR